MESRHPLRRRNQENFDRFIPCRSAMDFGYAITMVTMNNNERNRKENSSEYSVLYRQKLAEAAELPSRILAFRNKPLKPIQQSPSSPQAKPSKPPRHIPQTSERKLDAPDILDDFCLNLLDWGCSNVLSIALENDVYLWNASNKSTAELVSVDEEDGPVTSISWCPDGSRLAIGLDSSLVQVWDTVANKQLTTLRSGHRAGVSSLAWNNSHILTTGGMNGKIVNNDVRVRSHINSYRGHTDEVCGLKWSLDGKKLASGGSDNVVHIWDRCAVSSSSRTTRWLHKFEEHTAAVKALAWCPFQSDLLASGGGEGDQCIKLWNMGTGERLDSVDTGSEVCALLWNKNERELLSSHGLTKNQLTLWKYPSMVKMAELNGHTSRVLYMTQSPDGCTVATAAADKTLRFWNVFGTPKRTPMTNHEPFANFNRIR